MASDAAADRPEQPKTETTLTTRIRINIPGSRPIPPVVVRKSVANGANGESSDATGASRTPAPDAGPAAPSGGPVDPDTGSHALPAGADGGGGEKASDWFAPRKAGAPKGGPGGAGANGAGLAAGSGAQGPASGGAPAARPGSGPGGPRNPSAGGGVPRPGGTKGAGLPGAGGTGPVAPGHGGGTGSFDVSRALAAGPLGSGPGESPYPAGPSAGSPAGGGEPRPDGLPYFSDGGQGNHGNQGGPAGATGGPVTGDTPLAVRGGVPDGQGFPGGPAGQGGPGGGQGGPAASDASGFPGGKGAQSGSPFSGAPAGADRPGGGLSDDTAILTPQIPAPEPGAPGAPGRGGAGDDVSGHTLTSGIPVVPPASNSPFGPGAHTDGPLPHQPPKLSEPVPPAAPAAAQSKKKKKKGRSKLVLLVTGLVTLGGIAYGAGLLMNHSDVPKGTSVLGVDIGGGTRDDAVKKLDDAFKERAAKPLQLSVDGDTVALKPDQAGLQLDGQATVRAAAVSDYNPVSVIGSLFGNGRAVAPVMPVDEEKLAAALERAAGGSGSAAEGTIEFESGKAVPVYGRAGKGIDVDRSTEAVEEAYRTQVETGRPAAVRVPTTQKEPKVSKAEVDRMMKEFAQPAMSGLVTVKAGTAVVQFSPENSLWKFIGVKATGQGKLVDHYDLDALKELYGGAFDGVLITRGNGNRTAVTPQDVVGALRPALLGKTEAERVGVIETDPS